MRYEFAPDLQIKAEDISRKIFPHIRVDRVRCFRSYGSKARGTIARCHTLGKLMQKAIGIDAVYAIEFIVEEFEKLSPDEQVETIVHELMHIPKAFGGGFKHHDHVTDKNVKRMHKEYKRIKTLEDYERKGEF